MSLWSALADSMQLDVLCLASGQPNQELSDPLDVGRTAVTILNVPRANIAGNSWYTPSLALGRKLSGLHPTSVYVDGWESPAYLQACLFARHRKIRLAIGYRGTAQSQRHHGGPAATARRKVLALADVVVVAGDDSALAAHDAGVATHRIVIAPNTVDVSRFSRAKRLRSPHRKGTPHSVLYVGQLIRRKNVAGALMGWSSVRGDEDTFTVVGTGVELVNLRGLVQSLGLNSYVHFVGHANGDALIKQYAAADTLVLASFEEVWGLVVNEALAAGLHVVVSSKAGAAELVAPMNGVFVSEPTADALAAALGASAQSWNGPIAKPQILAFTPQKSAAIITDALLR